MCLTSILMRDPCTLLCFESEDIFLSKRANQRSDSIDSVIVAYRQFTKCHKIVKLPHKIFILSCICIGAEQFCGDNELINK